MAKNLKQKTSDTPLQDNNNELRRWESVALAAALVILLSPGLYLLKNSLAAKSPVASEETRFVGNEKCHKCHRSAFDKWKGSHHDKAMDEATAETVLGNFDNVFFTDPHNGVTSRFFTKDDRYYVETEGPDGQPGTFEITHTFGVTPLQQYLVPFPGGRLQCLNIAWDVENRHWYRLPPYEVKGPDDWLHWTNGGQTWNAMCAECHSTGVTKGFDAEDETYETTWTEIDVGCEACHGPGSRHIAWADRPPLARTETENYALDVRTSGIDAEKQVTLCAPCHSRRFQLGDNSHEEGELLDIMVPTLLEEGLYYPDGQILEEVYVYGSFVQSKMYRHGIRCSDCHDPHSLKPHKEKNALCTQCHQADVYDSTSHHFHKQTYRGKPSDGVLCVKCHMPGRIYMGADYRPDHSLRIPRPDLSADLGTPNACSSAGCHDDRPLSWSIDHYSKWYGKKRKAHYGEVIAAGRARKPDAGKKLVRLAEDPLIPEIVRATVLSLLRAYPGDAERSAMLRALDSDQPLIRYTAIRSLDQLGTEERVRRIAPKLYDPVGAVRMEAAVMLSTVPEDRVRRDDREAFHHALEQYSEAMRYNADFAAQRYNLGNLAANRNKTEEAADHYQRAIAIDEEFFPAKINLAMLYNRSGENEKAEKLLREVLAEQPENYETAYSLGLLLAEMNKLQEAADYLGTAADGLPEYGRARYNYALALLKLERYEEGVKQLHRALQTEPRNREYFGTLVDLYIRSGQVGRAVVLAQKLLEQDPEHPDALKFLNRIQKGR